MHRIHSPQALKGIVLPMSHAFTLGRVGLLLGLLPMLTIQGMAQEGKVGQLQIEQREGEPQGKYKGNTPVAVELAKRHARDMKGAKEIAAPGTAAQSFSLTPNAYTVECILTAKHAAFLLVVEDADRFSPESLDFMTSAAWSSAQLLFERKSAQPSPKFLTVCIGSPDSCSRLFHAKVQLDPGQTSPKIQQARGKDAMKAMAIVLQDIGIELAVSEAMSAPSNPPVAPPVPAPAPVLPTSIQNWKSKDGRILKASLVRFTDAQGTKAEFKREDGQLFEIAVDQFAPEELAKIAALRK